MFTLYVGCANHYVGKSIPNMLCVLYNVYLLLFKMQNKYEAVMAKSISSVAQKIMGGQMDNVNYQANIQRSKNRRGRKLITYDIHETFIKYTFEFLLHD